MLPSAPTLNDEILSLVGVRQAGLRVQVRQPRDAEEVNLQVTMLEQELKQICAEKGLQIDSEMEAIRISIAVEFHPNPDHAEFMSYIAHLALEQEMRLARLERTMIVPTYTLIDGGFYKLENLEEQVSRNLRAMMSRFLEHRDRAQSADG